MNYKNIFPLLIVLAFSLNANSQTDTISLFYDIGAYKLTESNTTKINNYLDKINDSTRYNIKIISSTDFLGTKESNYKLSQKRADFIKKLLLETKDSTVFKSFKTESIGEVFTDSLKKNIKEGIIKDRKTSIIFNKITNYKINAFNDLKIGEKIVLNNLVFHAGSYKVKKESYDTLEELVQFLNENPTIEIEIDGHVCCGDNYKEVQLDTLLKSKGGYGDLSGSRAKFVYQYLITNNIKEERLEYFGLGFQLPLHYPEKTEEEREENKRVEIKITKI